MYIKATNKGKRKKKKTKRKVERNCFENFSVIKYHDKPIKESVHFQNCK